MRHAGQQDITTITLAFSAYRGRPAADAQHPAAVLTGPYTIS